MLLSLFAMAEFMPCPDKDILNTSETSEYLSYTEAMSHIRNGKNNVGDKYVPSYCVVEPKIKWAVPPVNTKGTQLFTIHFSYHFKFSNSNFLIILNIRRRDKIIYSVHHQELICEHKMQELW